MGSSGSGVAAVGMVVGMVVVGSGVVLVAMVVAMVVVGSSGGRLVKKAPPPQNYTGGG